MHAQQMLLELKNVHGKSLTAVAKEIDVTQSTIQRIATGETKNCRSDIYCKIVSFYQTCKQQKTPSDN